MKPVPFTYHDPTTADEAVALLPELIADFASDEPLELREGLVAVDKGDEQRPHIAQLADQRSPHDVGQEPKNSPKWDTSYFFTADTKPRSAIVSSYAPTSKSSFARIAPYSAGE